jgi:hypothetical protein
VSMAVMQGKKIFWLIGKDRPMVVFAAKGSVLVNLDSQGLTVGLRLEKASRGP